MPRDSAPNFAIGHSLFDILRFKPQHRPTSPLSLANAVVDGTQSVSYVVTCMHHPCTHSFQATSGSVSAEAAFHVASLATPMGSGVFNP